MTEVFRFPKPLTAVKILKLIGDCEMKQAAHLLAKFYKVTVPETRVDPDVIYDAYPSTFKNTRAVYFDSSKRIVFKTVEIAKNYRTFLHEFFHHLGNEKHIKHNNETPDDWAHQFIQSCEPAYFLLASKDYVKGEFHKLSALSIRNLRQSEIRGILGPGHQLYNNDNYKYDRKSRTWMITQEGRQLWRFILKYYGWNDEWVKIVNLMQHSLTPELQVEMR